MTEQAWTVRRVLEWTRGHFDKQDIDDPRLTSEILLGHVLSLPRVKLYMDLDRPLTKEELATYRGLIQRRHHVSAGDTLHFDQLLQQLDADSPALGLAISGALHPRHDGIGDDDAGQVLAHPLRRLH